MGARLYIVEKFNNKWRTLYSHWGVDILKDFLRKDYEEAIKKYYETGKLNTIGALKRFAKFYNDLVGEELERGGKWEEISGPLDIIDLKNIVIEGYIINNGYDYFVIFTFITNKVNGGILGKITDDSRTNYKILALYEHYKPITQFFDTAFREIDAEKIKEEMLRYYHKWHNRGEEPIYLVFDIDRYMEKLITGEIKLVF